MRHRLIVLMVAITAVFLMPPVPAAAQARGANAQAQTYTPPKTGFGQPDLQGIWQVLDYSATYNIEPHTAIFGVPAGQGVIVDPPSRTIPYLPGAVAKRQENFRNRVALDPINKCYKPGVPRITYMHFPFQILQTPQFVTLVYEYIHNTRTVYLNRKTHLEGLDFWNGDSIGRWEGNTLVVDVGDFNDQTWFDASGNYHSEALHLEERYTRTDRDTITYEVTVTDPTVFSRPWRMSMLLYRHKEKNFRILEYECHAYAEDAAKEQSR